MNFHSSTLSLTNEKAKVMDRLEWLNYLRLIYNQAANVPSLRTASVSITTEAFLNGLIDNVGGLPLQDRDEYNQNCNLIGLSLDDIFQCFKGEFGKMINWDYILNQVLTCQRDTSPESPRSFDLNELVYISKVTHSSVDMEEPRPSRMSDLRIPSSPPETGLKRSSSSIQKKKRR